MTKNKRLTAGKTVAALKSLRELHSKVISLCQCSIEMLAHPDATDEQVLQVRDLVRNAVTGYNKTYNHLAQYADAYTWDTLGAKYKLPYRTAKSN